MLGINKKQFSKAGCPKCYFIVFLLFFAFGVAILFADFFYGRYEILGKLLIASEKVNACSAYPRIIKKQVPPGAQQIKSICENVPLFRPKDQGSVYTTCYVLLLRSLQNHQLLSIRHGSFLNEG